MTAYELLCILARHLGAEVAIIEGDDYENKKRQLSVCVSDEGKVVIQYWD